VKLVQDGDGETTFAFPVELFDAVAVLIQPRKRRQLTEDQKRELTERLPKVMPKNASQEHSQAAQIASDGSR
jgi:hypothetical protein